MARVLLGWELGLGLGHVQKLICVARSLAAANHTPVLALKNLVEPANLLAEVSFQVMQAPFWSGAGTPPKGSENSLAGMMLASGMSDPTVLRILTLAWQQLLDLNHIDLIVCEHSPGLCLAAYATLPTLVIGSGFTVPPQLAPSLADQLVLTAIHQVQQQRHRSRPKCVSDLYSKAKRIVLTFPELDPHRTIRTDPVVGPAKMPLGPFLNRSSDKRQGQSALFAYLASDYAWTETILIGLASKRIPIQAFVRGASAELLARLKAAGVHTFASPPSISERLADCSAILHHGGAGITEAALIAGRPQILLPRYVEQELTAMSLEHLKVGIAPSGRLNANQFTDIVKQMMCDVRMLERAQGIATDIIARGPWPGVVAVVDACNDLLI